MNRVWCRVLLLAFFVNIANGQTFTKLAPLPTGRDLSGVWFTSPNEGWIAGDDHALYKTTDHGLTWTSMPSPGFQSEPFYDIAFLTPQIGFITGTSSDIQQDVYRTANGGASWQPVANIPFGSWYHIQFVNSTTGFMGANGALLRTTDVGVTWPLQSAYPDCPMIYGMDFIDANTGLVSGYQPSSQQDGIFKTTDGGETWTSTYNGYVNHAIYLSSSIAIACDLTNIILSTDGGDSWNSIGSIPSGVYSLAKVDGDAVVVAVSPGGDIWRTDDGGFTWSQRLVGISDLPARWVVRFLDTLNGYVVGQGGSIFGTTDGGITWAALNRGHNVEWHGIAAFSDSNVLLAGVHGYAQKTTNTGQNWEVQLLDPPTFGRDTYFSDMAMTGPDSAYIVGHWGSMFKTDDQGATWINVSSSVNPSYYANAVFFADEQNGWLAGFDYNTGPKHYIRQTSDGGLSWQPATLNVPALDIEFVGQTGFVLTTGQPLYKTSNGGSTWTSMLISTPTGMATSNMSMSWYSENVGYVAGFDGFLARTSNGGATWSRVRPSQANFVYMDVKAASPNEVWACGASQGGGNAIIIHSSDGGTTWTTWSLLGQYTVPVRLALTNSSIYAVGYPGDVYRMQLENAAGPGDLNGDQIVNLDDILCMLAAFTGDYACSDGLANADIAPCGGNGTVNLDDLLAVMRAFAGEEICP